MLQTALVGLLAGSLAIGTPDTGDDKKKTSDADKAVAEDIRTPGVFDTYSPDPETIQDTYAFGRSTSVAPIKFWVSYAWGEADQIWNVSGDANDGTDPLAVAGSEGDIVTQRINVGAQIDFVSLPAFKLGAGANLTVADNQFKAATPTNSPFTNGIGDVGSGFGLQGLKLYAQARGPVVGIHGGYILDLGSAREFGEQAERDLGAPFGVQPLSQSRSTGEITATALVAGNADFQPLLLPTSLSQSDQRDAIFVGADFDYPSEMWRLFGGIDLYMLTQAEDEPETAFDESSVDGDDLVNFMFGGGVKLSVFEVGAALQIQTRFANPIVENIGTEEGIPSHAGTIAPYVRISPPSLPASIFVKGAVQEEYTEFGYALGGANSPKPAIGFTAGITVGFE